MDRMCCARTESILLHGMSSEIDSISGLSPESRRLLEAQFIRRVNWTEFKYRSLSRRKRVLDAISRICVIITSILSAINITPQTSTTTLIFSFVLVLVFGVLTEWSRSEKLHTRAALLGHAAVALKHEGMDYLCGGGMYASFVDDETRAYSHEAALPCFLKSIATIAKKIDEEVVILEGGAGGEKMTATTAANVFVSPFVSPPVLPDAGAVFPARRADDMPSSASLLPSVLPPALPETKEEREMKEEPEAGPEDAGPVAIADEEQPPSAERGVDRDVLALVEGKEQEEEA